MDILAASIIVVVVLFGFGLVGALSARRNLILVFMSIELMLMAVVLGFGFQAVIFEDVFYQLLVLVFLVLGGAEASVGFAVLIVYYRLSGSLDFNIITLCKG